MPNCHRAISSGSTGLLLRGSHGAAHTSTFRSGTGPGQGPRSLELANTRPQARTSRPRGHALAQRGAVATRIYLTSADGRTGPSTVAVGLLDTLASSVPRGGVFRPIVRADVERDYILELLVAHASAGQSYEDCVGVDYDALHADPDAALARIVERFAEVERGCDAVLILGSDYTDVGTPTELSTNGRIAANLAAPVVLVTGGRQSDGDGARTPQQCAELARIALGELREEHAETLAI